jgi:hypothetical protein
MIGMLEHWNYATAFRESLPYRILKNLLNSLGAAARSQIDRHDRNIGNVLFFFYFVQNTEMWRTGESEFNSRQTQRFSSSPPYADQSRDTRNFSQGAKRLGSKIDYHSPLPSAEVNSANPTSPLRGA